MTALTRPRSSNTAPAFTSVASLATSATLVAGASSASFTLSADIFDVMFSGGIKVGAAPTAGAIEVWLIPQRTNGSWPDAFDGTDKAVSVRSHDALAAYGKRLASIITTNAADATWEFYEAISAAMNSNAFPTICQLFVVHSTVQALASSGSAIGYIEVSGAY